MDRSLISVSTGSLDIGWIILTTGSRPTALQAAVASIDDSLLPEGRNQSIIVVANGCSAVSPSAMLDLAAVESSENLGVPGGRDLGVRSSTASILAFLDDDAELKSEASRQILDAFEADPTLGAVALRLIDEDGATSRRHVPRLGARGATESGEVALFLGGACAIRRSAYEQVGGYFTELFYGHEEVELCWRLIDSGWKIEYLAEATVFHPRTEISRHADGWHLTGRNRVWIARRTLPWPVVIPHVLIWLLFGARRAPKGECRRSYVRGWRSGWSADIYRQPIGWRGVWRLTKLRRPPII